MGGYLGAEEEEEEEEGGKDRRTGGGESKEGEDDDNDDDDDACDAVLTHVRGTGGACKRHSIPMFEDSRFMSRGSEAIPDRLVFRYIRSRDYNGDKKRKNCTVLGVLVSLQKKSGFFIYTYWRFLSHVQVPQKKGATALVGMEFALAWHIHGIGHSYQASSHG